MYTVTSMVKRGLRVRVSGEPLRRFAEKARRLGFIIGKALRKAMELLANARGSFATQRMRGFVKSRLSYEELEDAYSTFKG